MRFRACAALACALVLSITGAASAAESTSAARDTAPFYTAKVHKKVLQRDGKGVRIESFLEHAKALAAAG